MINELWSGSEIWHYWLDAPEKEKNVHNELSAQWEIQIVFFKGNEEAARSVTGQSMMEKSKFH